jgi:tetratricopeptide (TPR) repeat protein
MPHLEPTYLRYIYDGLVKGSIHPENAAELPEGLIGMYEEAFEERTSVVKRQKLLQRFAIWALLKKEVSAEFVAEILGETEDDIQDFISTYSAWFNSPESGKYQLYHERLKVYLLQKLGEGEIHTLHEKLITRLERAIEEQKADEFEWYGLEFLAGHLGVSAMLNGDGKKLIELAYSQTYWQRQLKISKGYTWTKNGLKEVMSWASKYNDDEVIECGLQMVDLHHQEQNAAPQIVALVAEGDFDAALKRIEQFGGNDKQGLQRKFILYMLCLMELTLLESKDKPYRKEGIEKLLKHLDEQLPVDHSVLNWNDFFSSYLMFQMACEWDECGLDYLIVFNRTNTWDVEWIKERGPYSDLQFEVLWTCAQLISLERAKSMVLSTISGILAKQDKIEKALQCARDISHNSDLSSVFLHIYISLNKKGKIEEESYAKQKSIYYALSIKDLSERNNSLQAISIEFAKRGKIEEATKYLKEISDQTMRSWTLRSICSELAKQGKITEALLHARDIFSDRIKNEALLEISSELNKTGNIKEAELILTEALTCARRIINTSDMSWALQTSSKELAKQGRIKEAILCARDICEKPAKCLALLTISSELNKLGKIRRSEHTIQETLECAQSILNDFDKSWAIMTISYELSKQGMNEKALACARSISDAYCKSLALSGVASILAKKVETKKSESIIHEALECTQLILTKAQRDMALDFISSELAEQGSFVNLDKCVSFSRGNNSFLKKISNQLATKGKAEEAIILINKSLEHSKELPDDITKIEFLLNISAELTKHRKLEGASLAMQEGIEYARKTSFGVTEVLFFKTAYWQICKELEKQGRTIEANDIMKEALQYIDEISDEFLKNIALNTISNAFAEEQNIEESFLCVQKISDSIWKNSALESIAIALAKELRIEEAIECVQSIGNNLIIGKVIQTISSTLAKKGKINEALEYAQNISSESEKSIALKTISNELAKQGKIQKSLYCAQLITNELDKSTSLLNISNKLFNLGEIEKAVSSIQQAIELLKVIKTEADKNVVLKNISKEMAKQANWIMAENIGLEIQKISVRQNCWRNIGANAFYDYGLQSALVSLNNFKKTETKTHYLKGLMDAIGRMNSIEYTKKVFLSVSGYYLNDIESMEALLKRHAVHQFFFEDPSLAKIERFNRTLNLEWAIDIKNKISKF